MVVDEAYAPFTDASFMARLGEYPNLLVLRTVSKMGLAGLRLGLLAGPPAGSTKIDKTAPALQHQRADPGQRAVRAAPPAVLDEQASVSVPTAQAVPALMRCRV